MDFQVEELTLEVANVAQAFAEKYIKPNVRDWDEKQFFPKDLFKEIGALGMMGVLVPERLGGAGLGYMEYVAVVREFAKVCPSIALSVAAHNSLCVGHILQYGNEEQQHFYLPRLASGEWLGAWGLTEPQTGSDAGNMQTTAEWKDGHWVLNGTKNWITHGLSADVAVVITRTGEPRSKQNTTTFIVEKGTDGFKGGKKEDKLGMRSSETAEMIFDDCKIVSAQMIGEKGEGFKQAMTVLDGGRISIAALSLGIAEGAYFAALQYAKEREQFGKPIAEFQAIAFKLADMATQIAAAELLTNKAACLKQHHQDSTMYSAIAKYFASEVAVAVSTDAVQIFGGYGYTKDYPVEKFYRDSKLCTIGEGTSEIQKMVISRKILA